MKHKRFFIISATTLIVVILGFFIWSYIKSPKYSLYKIKQAFDEHDLTSFEKYVDIDGVISSLIDQSMNGVNDTRPTSGLAKGIAGLMKPQVVSLVKNELIKLIETGNFEKSNESTNQIIITDFWTKSEIKSRTGDIDRIQIDNKIANVEVKFRNERFDTILTLNIKMRDKGSYWQLAEFSNFHILYSTLEQLEQKRIDKINEPAFLQINNSLRVRVGYSFLETWDVEVSNIGTKIITDYLIEIETSQRAYQIRKKSDQYLMPNTREHQLRRMDYYRGKSEPLTIKYIKFEDGKELTLVEKWKP